MSTDAMVLDAASRRSFYRGEGLVADGAVSSWHAEPDGAGRTGVTGTVVDRGRTVTGVHVSFDHEAGRIVSFGCPCGGPRGEDGMCKHAVAVALAYLDARRRRTPNAGPAEAQGTLGADEAPAGPDAPASYRKPSAAGPETGVSRNGGSSELIGRLKTQTQSLLAQYKAQEDAKAAGGEQGGARTGAIQEPQTSPEVGRMVLAYSEARSAAADPAPSVDCEAAGEAVELYPSITAGGRVGGTPEGGRVWDVRLRIGRGNIRYLVRRPDELLRAWETGARHGYGRNLSFAHTRAAFSDRANALLALLARVRHAQGAARGAARAALPSGGAPAKAIALSDYDAADLLDVMDGAAVQFEPRFAAGGAHARELAVVDGDPALEVRVARGTRGGYDLELPAGSDCVLAGNRMYLLLEDRAWRCTDAYRLRMGAFCRAAMPASSPLHVRDGDMPAFCSAVLPSVAAAAHVALPEGVAGLVPPPACFSFRLGLDRGLVTCEAVVSYGGVEVGLFEPVAPGQPARDLLAERGAQETVHGLFGHALVRPSAAPYTRAADDGPRGRVADWPVGEKPAGRPCFEEDDAESLYRLLTEGVAALGLLGDVYLSKNLRSVGVRPAPRVRVAASLKAGLLDIAVDSEDLSPADLLAYLDSFERRQRFVRLADGDVMHIDGGVRAVAELADALGVSARGLVGGTEEIPANRALFVDDAMKRAEGVRFDRDEAFRALVRDFDAVGDNDFVEPASLRGVLRPYQRAGFKWISTLAKLGFGGILADDMGLGKTLQVIAYLLAAHEAGQEDPSLVVCPASLVYNWTAEIGRFAPQLDVAAVVGPCGDRAALVRQAREHDVLVTSYELLKRDVELYARQTFHCQVLDEAQCIKNHATQTARCAKRVRAHFRLALTGTPVENRLAELWSILDFAMPGLLGTYDAFRRRYEVPVVNGDEEAARRLQGMVGPFVLRRMKDGVLKDLPPKTESVVYARMSGEQEHLYRATASSLALSLASQLPADFAARRVEVLAELTKLRQICCDPRLLYENYEGGSAKLEAALELVASAVDGGHKVLFFSQFTSMLDIVGDRLRATGVAHHVLTGATPKEQRARLVASFATDDVPVFLISLKAGGVGLNLTAADIVVHYDPWWNLAAQNQATDRAHRIGQRRVVTVFKLIAQDTIEEKIVQLQEAKRALAESILGGKAAASATLTREDILALLEG